LYFEITIKKGNKLTKLAKVAPAPSTTNKAGIAQQIRVEDDANNAKRPGSFSLISLIYI